MTAIHDSLLGQRCVVVGGVGAVGSMFVDRLQRAGAEIYVIDIAPGRTDCIGARTRYEQADIADITPRLEIELRRADLVLLAVREEVALAVIRQIIELLQPGALLIDTLSVKARILDAVSATTAAVEIISLNPMFGPSLGIDGRPVAAVVVRDGPRAQQLLRLIESWGGRLVRMTKESHDRLASVTQALTHAAVLAFGFALAALQADITELSAIAPPPHKTLLALLARILSNAPETYWDVQSSNPQASPARMALVRELRNLVEVIENHDKDYFEAALDDLRAFLDQDLEIYSNICAHIFEGIDNAGRRRTP